MLPGRDGTLAQGGYCFALSLTNRHELAQRVMCEFIGEELRRSEPCWVCGYSVPAPGPLAQPVGQEASHCAKDGTGGVFLSRR